MNGGILSNDIVFNSVIKIKKSMSTTITKNVQKHDTKNVNKNIEVAVRMRPILQEFEDQEVW